MKKNRLLMTIVYSFLFILLIIAILIIRGNNYSVYLVVNNDGYVISTSDLTKNLLKDSINSDEADIKAVHFSISDTIYEKSGKLFLGDDRTPLNDSFPLFINNASTIMTLTDKPSLISDDFNYTQTYNGLYINNGVTFNPDMEKAYREEFILMDLSNGLYMNTKEMLVKGSFFVEQNVPDNSVIRFMENEIRYYTIEKNVFKLYTIKPLSEGSTISVNGKEYPYYDFLERLGLYEKEKLREQEKKEKNTPLPVKQATIPMQNKTTLDNNETKAIEKIDAPTEDTQPAEDTIVPATDSVTPASQSKEEKEPKTAKPAENSYAYTGEPAKEAEPATPAEPAKPNNLPASAPGPSGSDSGSSDDTSVVIPPVETPPVIKNWVKPVVKLNEITTSVYSILSPNMVVENPEFLYRSGVSFEIYDSQKKLVMRKSFNGSGDVSVGPLKPDTDYFVTVKMTYIDKTALKAEETLVELRAVKTRPISELTPLKLYWENGTIFYNKIQLKNLNIRNAVKSTRETTDSNGNLVLENTYIETVQYMNRVETVIKEKDNSKNSYNFAVASKDLNDLRLGKSVLYESSGKIGSDKEYDYEFVCYDRFGNVLPQEGLLKGFTHTCKQPPKAEIKLLKNEVKNAEVRIELLNGDNAEIKEKSTFFAIYDRNDNPVKTRVSRMDKDGNYVIDKSADEIHTLDQNHNSIKFLDLLDYEIYKIKVFSTYNINDSAGWYENTVIGEAKFTTTPISSLGLAFFDVAVKDITSDSANVTVSLNKERTDARLVDLISNLDFIIMKKASNEGAGVKVSYNYDSKTSETPGENGMISLDSSAIDFMKTDKAGLFTFKIENLESKSEYSIIIKPKVAMGSIDNQIYREITTYYTPNSFITMKKTPVINIQAIYASADFIKLYGVTVSDPDSAIVSYPVTLSVYDESGSQIDTYDINSSQTVETISISKLMRNKPYTFRFFAKEFNNGFDMKTYIKNQELYYSELAPKKEPLVIITREAVSGSLQLIGMDRNKTVNTMNISAANMSAAKGITYNSTYKRFNNNNNVKSGKYWATVDFGYDIVNNFQIGFSYASKAVDYKIYLSDPDTNPTAQPIGYLSLGQRTTDNNYCRWSDIKYFDNNFSLTGKNTIYLVVTTTDGTNGIPYLWGMRFNKGVQCESSKFYANINASVNDARNELGQVPSYYVKVYKNDVWVDTRRHEWSQNANGKYTLKMYSVAPDKSETLIDQKEYSGEARTCNTDFYYELDKGYNTYRFELWSIVFDYEIKLGQEEFTTEKEIVGIKTQEDMNYIRYGLDKKYFVLNDISFTYNANNITGSAYFNGELDFRGHKLTYNAQAALIPYIGYTGALKNMVFTYVDGWGTDVERKTDRIVTYNYGKIQNIMVIRNNGNFAQSYKTDTSGICYMNNETGVIENFVVKLKDPLISTNNSAGVATYNKGVIRNGYVYGAPIKMTGRDYITEEQYSSNTVMGGIVSANYADGIIENVYSLSNIETRPVLSVNDYAFDLVGINEGTIKNSFSAGDVYYGDNIRDGFGPAYRSRYTGNASNTYYYSEENYGKTDNKRISKLVLYDSLWYNRIFNNSNNSKPGQFELNPVHMGYYPHVLMPDLMPLQEYIKLPSLSAADDIKIVDADIIEQGENTAKAVLTFNNPDHFEITDIKAQWLNIEVLSQEEDGKFYRVTVRITQPTETKYYSSYNITSFTYSLGFRGISRQMEYAEDNYPTIPVEFYKPVSTVAGWAEMKNDLKQNYRLVQDLDFYGYVSSIPVIPAPNLTMDPNNALFPNDAFDGKLDGGGHTISGIDTGTTGYVFGKLTGTIKNLTVKNLDIKKGNCQYKGFIGRMFGGALVDNVHILGMEATSYRQCGAITSDIYAAAIVNSSAHDVKIETSAEGNYTQYVGGLVGKQRNTAMNNINIMNSYTDGVDIKVLSAGDCGGAGALAGFVRAGSDIRHVYAINGNIDTAYKNVGGLIGAVDTGTNYQSSLFSLKDYFVDVDISTITERAGGVIGFTSVKNAEDNSNGLVLGNVFTSKPNATEVGRFFGLNTAQTGGIYGYECSLVNGKLNKDSSLLTYSFLCNPSTYDTGGILNWDKDFMVDSQKLSQGIMPKLRLTSGKEPVPYQPDYKLENNAVKITNVNSRNYSSGELFIVQIETAHQPDITITGAKFNGLVAAGLADPSEAVKIVKNSTGTTIQYVLALEGYYDCYYLTEITYEMGGVQYSQKMKMNVGIAPQYLKISSAAQWNSLMAEGQKRDKRYNIQLTGDLDFGPFNGTAANSVIINSLIGSDPDNWNIIKGIKMNSSKPFIEAAYGNISYIKFENISLTKDQAGNPASVNTYGLFGAVTGDIFNVNFNNISINAYNSAYVGLAALEYGMNYNIDIDKVFIKETFGTVPERRAIGGLIGRLSGSGGVYNLSAKNFTVEGRDYVGGIVGMQEDGRNLWNIKVENAVVSALTSTLSGNYVGGIAGYADSSALSNRFGNSSVKKTIVAGNSYIGGVDGIGNILGNSAFTNQQNDDYLTTSENVFVAATGPLAGAISGQGEVYRAEVRNSQVYGTYYVGGITGNGPAQLTSCLDSVIGTVFDREETNANGGNKVFQNYITQKQAYYNTIKTQTQDTDIKTVYDKAIEILSYMVTTQRKGSWSGTTFTGSTNTRIGGISGRTMGVYNSVTANCRIGSYGASDVGGIVGLVEAASSNITYPYRIIASGCQNSKVYGLQNIGGVAGRYLRGYMESCYSNAEVTASSMSAGGIVGLVKATGLGSLSETPYFNHLYFAGTVTAQDYAAGIIGKMEQDLYNINEGWLMLGKVITTNPNSKAAFHLNRQLGDTRRITKAGVYKDSSVSINSQVRTAQNLTPLELLETSVFDTAGLKNESSYYTQLGWTQGTGTTSSNYTSRYWIYNGLANGYMPYLDYVPARNYGLNFGYRNMKYQEGYTPDPKDNTKALVDADGNYVYSYETYKGGVPIPGSGVPVVKRAMLLNRAVSTGLPKVEYYAVDADKLNIEFSAVNPDTSFKVLASGEVVAEGKVENRTFTLDYDFRTELEIIVDNGSSQEHYNVYPEDIRRDIMTWKSDYYYISATGLKGNRPTLNGYFVNLYAGHILNANGTVLDAETGRFVRSVEKIALSKTTIPLNNFDYENCKIETYKNYTLVDATNRENLRLYVKGGELSAISSNLPATLDSIILDSYNGRSYCSVLGNDGIIVNMTDTVLNIPEGLDNTNIQYMTNNLNSSGHIVLIRYNDGAVAGFNYITGEKLDIDSPRSTSAGYGDGNSSALRATNSLNTNFSSMYVDVMAFEADLNEMGWAVIDGTNTDNGTAVSEDGGVLNEDASKMVMYLEGSFIMEDGKQAANSDMSGQKPLNVLPAENGNELNKTNANQISDNALANNSNTDSATGRPFNSTNNIAEALKAAQDMESAASKSVTVINDPTDKNADPQNSSPSVADKNQLLGNEAPDNSIYANLEVVAAEKAAVLKAVELGVNQDKAAALVKATVNKAVGMGATVEQIKAILEASMKEAYSTTTQNRNGQKLSLGTFNVILNKAVEKQMTSEQKASEATKEDLKTVMSDETGKTSGTSRKYIPVFDSVKGKYVLYDQNDLLKKKEDKIETVNEKVQKSGRMIDYHSKQKADINGAGDENLYGFILVCAAIAGITLLLSYLIINRRKEASL